MPQDPITFFSPQWIENQTRKYCFFNAQELTLDPLINTSKRTECALLSHLSVIKISGEDANAFLQGQLTLNVNAEKKTGTYLSRKGRIIAFFYFMSDKNNYYLIMPKDISAVFINQLRKYIFMSKVTIDVLEGLVISSNPLVFKTLNASLLIDTPTLSLENEVITFINDQQIKKLYNLYTENKITLVGDWAWHKKNILANIPTIYSHSIAQFLIHELKLEDSVDFKKGCYIGQEIVARMHYKSKLTYSLKTFIHSSQNITQPGDELIVNDIKLGKVIDSLSDLNNNHLYLLTHKNKIIM